MQKNTTHDQDEIEVFRAAVRAFRYDEDEFTLRYVQTAKPASATCDLVVVRRISNGVERAYCANESTAWLVSFFDDLNLGVFGEYVHPGWQRPLVESSVNYKRK
jgi:hypothetical protein